MKDEEKLTLIQLVESREEGDDIRIKLRLQDGREIYVLIPNKQYWAVDCGDSDEPYGLNMTSRGHYS